MEEQEIKTRINDRYEMTIHHGNSLFYLKKKFFQQFTGDIVISISKDHLGEIIVKEQKKGRIRQRYYSKKLLEEIASIVKDNETMHFGFFEDKERKIWRGILLPKFHSSILWENLSNVYIGKQIFDESVATDTLKVMKAKYYPLLEDEELEHFYMLGYEIVRRHYSYLGNEEYNGICMCTWALADECARIQRACKNVESKISLNQDVNNQSNCTYASFFGISDVCFYNIEIKEFVSYLSNWEKIVLKILSNDEKPWYIYYSGTPFEKIILEGREALQEKACNYYGIEYIKSMLKW